MANETSGQSQMTTYAVVATHIGTGHRRILKSGLTEQNAEAVVRMAVMRRGVEEEWFQAEMEVANGKA